MSLSVRISSLRSMLADLPRLAREVWGYIRYRRQVHRDLERLGRGIKPVDCVGLMDALERIHRHRFPDRLWPAHRPLEVTISEDSNALETFYLALICRVADPQAIFEIGTYEGRTANIMALHTSPNCRIYTLDLPPGKTETHLPLGHGDRFWLDKTATRVGKRLGALPNPTDNARIEQLFGDSATFDYSPYRGCMDLVFVDGAHSYEYVLSDARNALTLLTPRGFILMHDLLTHVGVTQAALVLRQQHEVIHVAQTSFAILFPATEDKRER